MVFRIGPACPGLLVLGMAAGCVDHPMANEPVPVDVPDGGIVLYASLSTYPVAGSDVQSLAMSVSGGGTGPGRDRFIGYHAWSITWKIEALTPGTECGIRRATVYLDSRITLPEWEAPRNPDPSLESQWSEFLFALREHEVGHQLLVMKGAEQVRRTLLGVTAPHCEQVVAKADSAAHDVLTGIRAEDARYDSETHHGATQGAIWPPSTPSPPGTAHRGRPAAVSG